MPVRPAVKARDPIKGLDCTSHAVRVSQSKAGGKWRCQGDCIEAVFDEPSLKGPPFRAIVERITRKQGTLAPLVVKKVSDAIALVAMRRF